MLHVPPISSSTLSPQCYFLNSTNHAAPHYAVFPTPCHFLPLSPTYSPQHPALQQPHNMSHPQQTSTNYVLLYLFVKTLFCSVCLSRIVGQSLCCVVSTMWVGDRQTDSGFFWLRIRRSAGFCERVMNLRGPLSPEDGCTTVFGNSRAFECSRGSVFSVRYGLDSHFVGVMAQAVSRRLVTISAGPDSIPGQTMCGLWWTQWHLLCWEAPYRSRRLPEPLQLSRYSEHSADCNIRRLCYRHFLSILQRVQTG
jgi:hypothetical protein